MIHKARRFANACRGALLLVGFGSATVATLPAQDSTVRLTVFVVGAKQEASAQVLSDLVRGAGMVTRLVERAACAPEALRAADVVLVDWPASEPLGDRLPLGDFERWDRPTVFVGDGGDLFARAWGLPTAAEMAAMQPDQRGPEMQERQPPAGAKTVVWRQGHLFHFLGPGPAGDDATERAHLLQTLQLAARFVSDRPIFRHGAPAGREPSDAERARRQRIADGCREFGVEPNAPSVHLTLAGRIGGAEAKSIASLLADLVPEGRVVEPTKNNWNSWLRPRCDRLVWDPLSQAWRLDLLAHWRGVATALCHGDDRADGSERQPEAVALAAKVVQHHGGRALADLATFSCWHGNVHFLWDRRNGLFRMENHAKPPVGMRATAWTVSVIDTAADNEITWGGGPPPRPRVSARGYWRDLVEHVFLPAMLLDPGVSLRRCAEYDAGGKQAIAARLAGRGMDPVAEHILLVDPASGAVANIRRLERGRVQRDLRVAATSPCGPLLLPVDLVDESSRNQRRFLVEEAKWNPDLPTDLATAAERLVGPRDR